MRMKRDTPLFFMPSSLYGCPLVSGLKLCDLLVIMLLCLPSWATYAESLVAEMAVKEETAVKEGMADRPLRIAIEPSPHAGKDADGRVRGLVPELFEGIAVHMSRRVEFVFMPYLRGLHELEQGRIDIMYAYDIGDSGIHLPSNIIRTERPEATMPLSLYARRDRNISINSKSGMQAYKTGFVRMAVASERTWDDEQGEAFYFSSVEALLKALLIGHVDVAALGPSAGWVVKAKFGEELVRVYEYSFLHLYPVFSAASQQDLDANLLCQQYLTARAKAVIEGLYANVMRANRVEFLMPYFEQAGGFLSTEDSCVSSATATL